MLKGIDVSSWQSPGAINYKEYDFVIIKASEGVNYVDPGLDRHLTALFGTTDPTPQKDKCYGFYHYARPDLGNTPEAEAKDFLGCISTQVGNCVMVLDWEGDSLNYSPEWAKGWLDYVYKQTGVKPMLYIQASQAKMAKYAPIAAADYGLWVAHWGVASPSFSNWQDYAIWQYRGSPLDMDFFNGDKNAWWKYCGRKPEQEETGVDEKTVRKIAQEEINKYFSALEKNTEISDWAETAVNFVLQYGIMTGDKSGDKKAFRPKDFLTREEEAVVMHNLYTMLRGIFETK